MFTPQELQVIAALLNRVDLKGNEALTVAQLQLKVNSLIKPEAPVETKEEAPTTE